MLLIHLFIFQTNVYTRHYAFPFIPYPFYSISLLFHIPFIPYPFYSIPFCYGLNTSNARAYPFSPSSFFSPISLPSSLHNIWCLPCKPNPTNHYILYALFPSYLRFTGFSLYTLTFLPLPCLCTFCIFMCPFIHHFVHHSFFLGGFINSFQPFLCISSKIKFLTNSLYPCPIWSRYLPNFSSSSCVNVTFRCAVLFFMYSRMYAVLSNFPPISYIFTPILFKSYTLWY